MDIKVVVGSNYGDEGKGLMSYYLSRQGKNVLNVLYNGGAQRGHTVETQDGKRYVHHHLGCGTLAGADTYFDSEFIVNPILFNEEMKDMKKEYELSPRVYLNPNCRVTTPYDMILNQMLEESRAEGKHGSCGLGIWETIKRYETSEYDLSFIQMTTLSNEGLEDYLDAIAKDYVSRRVTEYGIQKEIVNKYIHHILDRNLIKAFILDLREMDEKIWYAGIRAFLQDYDTIVFEGAQGLALDKDNMDEFPHLTPSNTGIRNVLRTLREKRVEYDTLDVWYVTRSYFTRHGAGNMPTECGKEEINKEIEDKTNVPNLHQGSIRYGRMDVDAMLSRIDKDWSLLQEREKVKATRNLAVTHCNYKELTQEEKSKIESSFAQVKYISKKWAE